MKREIPEAFRYVVPGKRETWPNATFAEWVELRTRLVQRRKKYMSQAERFRLWAELSTRARETLRAEDRKLGRKDHGPLSGQQRARLVELLQKTTLNSKRYSGGYTPWEIEFLQSSEWIDKLRDNELPENPLYLIDSLVTWISAVELLAGLGEERAAYRKRRRDFLQNLAKPGKKYRTNKHPFLPKPIELMGIYRRTLIVLDHIRRGIAKAKRMGIVPDEYGAPYPCPICKIMYCSIQDARLCCPDDSTDQVKDILQSYRDCIFLGDATHTKWIAEFVKTLWNLGYETPCTAEDLMEWNQWHRITDADFHGFTKEFLSRTFDASLTTIQKYLTKTKLEPTYKKARLAKALRFYLEQEIPPLPHALWPAGSYEHLDRHRRPHPTIWPDILFRLV